MQRSLCLLKNFARPSFKWHTVNDGVMGGLSNGIVNFENHLIFTGFYAR